MVSLLELPVNSNRSTGNLNFFSYTIQICYKNVNGRSISLNLGANKREFQHVCYEFDDVMNIYLH